MIIARTFLDEREIALWLNDESNIEELKKEYSPEQYSARMNFEDKQVEVTKKIGYEEPVN